MRSRRRRGIRYNTRGTVITQSVGHKTRWIIRKFANDEDHAANKPFETAEVKGNILVNTGINLMWDLVTAAGGQGFDNANAYLGVGADNTAAQATDTDLIGGTAVRVGMNGGYPTSATQKVTFQSDFGSAVGNIAWEEFGVFNAAAAGTMLNRKCSAQGTKTAGQTWELTLEITLS